MIYRLNFPKWMSPKLCGIWEGRIKEIVSEVKTCSAPNLVIEVKFKKPSVSKEKLVERYSKRFAWSVLTPKEQQEKREKIKRWAEDNYESVRNRKINYTSGLFNWSRLGWTNWHGQPCRILLRLGVGVGDNEIAKLFAHEWRHYLQYKKNLLGKHLHCEPDAKRWAKRRMKKLAERGGEKI